MPEPIESRPILRLRSNFDDDPPETFDLVNVDQVVDFFLRRGPKCKSDEGRKERERLLRLFAAEFGNLPLTACKPAHLQLWIDGTESFRSNWTKGRVSATVQRAFNWSVRMGLIVRNPFAGVRYRRGRRGRDLTVAEFRALLRLACPAFRRILIFLRYTGARPGELRLLERCNLHPELSAFVLAEHKTAETLEDYEPRKIMLVPQMMKLVVWLGRHMKQKQRFLFVGTRGQPWSKRSLCKYLQRLRDRAGLPAEVRLHGCRHTFITQGLMNGVDPAAMAELVGHRSLKTTQRYIHMGSKTGHLLKAAEKAVKS